MKKILPIILTSILFSCQPSESEKRIQRMERIQVEMQEASKAYQSAIDRELKIVLAYGQDTAGVAESTASHRADQTKYKVKMDALAAEMDSLSKAK